jgi:hypothetical protein
MRHWIWQVGQVEAGDSGDEAAAENAQEAPRVLVIWFLCIQEAWGAGGPVG